MIISEHNCWGQDVYSGSRGGIPEGWRFSSYLFFLLQSLKSSMAFKHLVYMTKQRCTWGLPGVHCCVLCSLCVPCPAGEEQDGMGWPGLGFLLRDSSKWSSFCRTVGLFSWLHPGDVGRRCLPVLQPSLHPPPGWHTPCPRPKQLDFDSTAWRAGPIS